MRSAITLSDDALLCVAHVVSRRDMRGTLFDTRRVSYHTLATMANIKCPFQASKEFQNLSVVPKLAHYH